MSLPTRFVKMAGGGNDFLLFEADGRALAKEDRRRIALLCRRGLSVGADGALFLSGNGDGRMHLDYYNADGGLAAFCANGTRCAARYAVSRRLVAGSSLTLATGWAPIAARVGEDSVTLDLPPLPLPGPPVAISGEGLPPMATPMTVGVPHLVVRILSGLETLQVARLGRPLRSHGSMPKGANVNFVEVAGPGEIRVRTYERGVEGETLACGSGVVASAVVAALQWGVDVPTRCSTRSGVDFTVAFGKERDGVVDATLTGDAREIYSAELTEDAWQE